MAAQEEVGVGLAPAVLKLARDKLVAARGDPAVTNTTIRGNLVSDLEKMMDEMESVVRDKSTGKWLPLLEDVAYDICDMADEIRTNKDAAPVSMARMLPASVSASRQTKVRVIREALDKICRMKEQSNTGQRGMGYYLGRPSHYQKEQEQSNMGGYFVGRPAHYAEEEEQSNMVGYLVGRRINYDEKATSILVDQPFVVGRDEQVERILGFLLSPATEYPVFLPIFGLAGVGKTTLAQLVYNHPRSRDYYDARAWVSVSPKLDLENIGRSIVECLPNERYGGDDSNVLDSVKQSVHKLVGDGNKKVLVVLDDIWEQDQQKLDRLEGLLGRIGNHYHVAGSSKHVVNVVVTTRDEDIARRICTNKVQPYKLHPLSDDLCWAVIKQASRFENRNDRQDLDKIGREIIATKCGGLPLAAKVVGEMMSSMTHKQWLAYASTTDQWDDLFFSDAFQEPKNTIFSTLSLSYQSMPPILRLCFAYLATLPEKQNMAEDDIIHRWIALGLIEPSNGISTGHRIISRLLDISFLQHSNLAPTRGKHDDKGMIFFTMHSLIHYFARSLMSSTLVVKDGQNRRDLGKKRWRYALLTNVDLAAATFSGLLPSELRSLSLLCCSTMELSNVIFKFAKYLQVLELREPSMQKLSDSICLLGLLGYLNLSGCSGLVQLPESFGNLTSVLHINLSGCCGLVKLPESFGKLTSLLDINLSGCSRLVKLPESFAKLPSVQHINLSGCSGLKDLPKSFGNLTSVVHMNLSDCHGLDDLPKSFCKLSNLEYLNLSFCSCFMELHIALGGLTNLQYLNLSHPSCYALEHNDHLEQLKDIWAKLTKLQYLNLSMFTNPIFCYLPEEEKSLDCFQSIFKGLSSLEHLDLSHNIFLVDLPETLCDLSKLHTLNLSGCRRLKRIAKKIAEMKCTIVLRKCPSLESYSFVVHADDGAYSSNLVQLEDIVSCKELEVSCLEKVKYVEEAKRITLEQKKIEKLTLGWTMNRHVSSVDEALLADLVPPQKLQSLTLKGYGGNGLPAWLTSNLCLHLPNLEEVTIENIPKCHALPPLLLLPKLKQVVVRKMDSIKRIDAGKLSGGGGNRAELHRLVQFTLDDMKNLQEFNTIYHSGGEEFMFPTIDELVIQNCPKLKFGHFLPTTQRLQISACDQVMSSLPEGEAAVQGKGVEASSSSSSSSTSTSAARVTQLVVHNCKVPLGEWSLLYHLSGLRSLEIRGCNVLTGSQELIQTLSSVQSLCFYQCNGMTSLSKYLGDLTSLQELTIDGCQDIESLPDSMDKLSNLKDLRIQGCPKLQEWCKSADNKQKLAHIQIRDSATTANQTTNKQLTRGQSSLLVTLE